MSDVILVHHRTTRAMLLAEEIQRMREGRSDTIWDYNLPNHMFFTFGEWPCPAQVNYYVESGTRVRLSVA